MIGLLWVPEAHFDHEDYTVSIERARLAPPHLTWVYRASAELAGVRAYRYGSKPEDALCDLLNGLAELAFAEALAAQEEEADDGAENSEG